MPVLTSLFLVISLVLSVVLGAQTRSWTWGPAMIALAISTAAAVPAIWRKGRGGSDFGVTAFAALVVGWFAWRAWISPVAELGNADLMLLAAAVGGFVSVRGMEDSALAGRIFIWAAALLLAASVFVVGRQFVDPAFAPVFQTRAASLPSGFYSQYNEGANYLIASCMLVAAAALFGNHRMGTRIVWAVIAVAGFVAIYFTRSRGGIFGAGVGCGVLAAALLVSGRRSKARWFGPAVIAVPIVGLGLAAFVLYGWTSAQEVRQQGGISTILDNSSRLYLLGIAVSCVAMHPLVGGGSRSFSWESFQIFDGKTQGDLTMTLPDQVHNELVQSVTDYGIIGGGLLAGLLVTLLLRGAVRILFAEVAVGQREDINAWWAGGMAAFAGMFVQSSFSFVFHLFPGVLLLGISLGFLSRTVPGTGGKARVVATKSVLTAAAVACVIWLAATGWTGARVSQILWPTYFGKFASSWESRADALTQALQILPTAELYQARAVANQEMAAADSPDAAKFAERAIADYAQAEARHPYDPEPAINRANLLDGLQRDAEAEAAYTRAIQLQGGMEAAFRAHFLFSQALLRKGVRQYRAENPGPTLETTELAAQQVELAIKEMLSVTPTVAKLRVVTHESLGAAREANGDYVGAMEAYDFASKLDLGTTAHYRAGLLNGKIAAAAWAERNPGEALGRFIEAERRLKAAGEFLPDGVTLAQRNEYLAYLERTIAFLKGAKVEPIPVK